jgi:hypothetical protein
MDINLIKKYQKKTVPQLLKKATDVFNAYIRKRDEEQSCISCGKYCKLQAGHFYSAGHYSSLRFNEDNVNGQCKRCNYYLSANLNNYRINLEKKIGKERLEKLDQIAAQYKRTRFKWDRFSLIEIIDEYLKNKK